ncbi:hypothetical protein K431DRAFT_303256 [Polychaeton citri CBS 116435]|uniref:Nudix hydrolase domain-containing protein n=1 Tax=Polychaeton citri CBS 116435 TaxID=1314669 RepID=A0A9P4QBF6_9PEZI|nr:hypothetical protein K431DRAFT_303256 [Polychaeton citri CBS 116435]
MDRPSKTYLDLVQVNDNFPYDPEAISQYYALYLPQDEQPHGYLLPETVAKLPWTEHEFRILHIPPCSVTVLDTSHGADTAAAVNKAFADIVTRCLDQDLFHVLDKRHSEPFAVLGAKYPVRIERFATALFGTVSCGAHMVAYTTTTAANGGGSKVSDLWIPRRADHLYTYPGMLDTTVAGGVKAGVKPLTTIIEEAMEEASLPATLVRQHVKPRGVITTVSVTGKGFPGEQGLVMPDQIFVYDIELPNGVVPRPNDDEVSGFTCMGVEEVQTALKRDEFKPDSAAVLIDFFIRHGIVTPEEERDYVAIVTHLHRRLPFRTVPP